MALEVQGDQDEVQDQVGQEVRDEVQVAREVQVELKKNILNQNIFLFFFI